MVSIFPSSADGGVIVRDPNTGAEVSQPNTNNVDFPAQLNISCDFRALPQLCGSRVSPDQINAIVSELINFYVAMCPTREWNCSELDNMAGAFECFVENLAGSGLGNLCEVEIGEAQDEAQAYILYCDGDTLKRWSIQDEGGMIEFIMTLMCDLPQGAIGTGDQILYCRNGELRKGLYDSINLYVGPWVQNRTYTTSNMVQKDGKLYSPNANIAAGTPFVIGTSGQTWREVSQNVIPTFDPANDYSEDTVILNNDDGKYYAANGDIPAGTPFSVGTGPLQWREVDPFATSILNWSSSKNYKKFNVVANQGYIYRAKKDTPGGLTNGNDWEIIGGERNIYRGEWSQGGSYNYNDVVMYRINGAPYKLYRANSNIPSQTAWAVGTAANEWTEISPNVGIEFQFDVAYPKWSIVSYQANLYYANDDIPANYSNIPPSNQGTSGKTWTLMGTQIIIPAFSSTRRWRAGEAFVQPLNAYNSEPGLWRAASDVNAAQFNPGSFVLIGERNKWRGDWTLEDPYKAGDVVINYGYTAEPYGTMFYANSNMAPNTAFVVGTGANKWTKLNPAGSGGGSGSGGSLLKVYNPNQPYKKNDLVLTDFGIYMAGDDMPAGYPFRDDNAAASFIPYNSGRPIQILPARANICERNHRNATLAFTSNEPNKYYQLVQGQGYKPGDTISGYSTGSQLQFFVSSSMPPLRTPDGTFLRNKNYASFMLRCIGVTNGGTTPEWLLSGDLQTV